MVVDRGSAGAGGTPPCRTRPPLGVVVDRAAPPPPELLQLLAGACHGEHGVLVAASVDKAGHRVALPGLPSDREGGSGREGEPPPRGAPWETASRGGVLWYCVVLYCKVLHCIVLYCIVLYCIVLYCIVL